MMGIDPYGLAMHKNFIDWKSPSPKDQNLMAWADHYMPENFNNIVIHGNEKGQLSRTYDGSDKGDFRSVADISKILDEKYGYDPKLPILMSVCYGGYGGEDSPAQKLARAKRNYVIAATSSVYSNVKYKNGQPLYGHPLLPSDGQWMLFSPKPNEAPLPFRPKWK